MYVNTMQCFITYRILYVVTRDGIINQYRMDGQEGLINSFDDFEFFIISAMTIDYANNQLYLKVHDDDDEPYLLSRIDSDFTNSKTTIFNLKTFISTYGYPLSFVVHDGFIYVMIRNRGLFQFFVSPTALSCYALTQVNKSYSAKIIHYGRQPGED